MADKIFEDEFMDKQSDMISVCMELLEDISGLEKIYAYGYVAPGGKVYSFDACARVAGEMRQLHELVSDVGEIISLLGWGTQYIEEMDGICKKYNQPTPIVTMMYFDVLTHKYEATYEYNLNSDADTDEIFAAWFEELKNCGGNM